METLLKYSHTLAKLPANNLETIVVSSHLFRWQPQERLPHENAYSSTFHVVCSNTNCRHITLHNFIQKIKWSSFSTMNMHVACQNNCRPPRHPKAENWLHAADFSHKNKKTGPWPKESTVTSPLPKACDLNAPKSRRWLSCLFRLHWFCLVWFSFGWRCVCARLLTLSLSLSFALWPSPRLSFRCCCYFVLSRHVTWVCVSCDSELSRKPIYTCCCTIVGAWVR